MLYYPWLLALTQIFGYIILLDDVLHMLLQFKPITTDYRIYFEIL